ncbi:hypothetical protein [Rathayibacter sp. VKM Ac-2630]|nr:hypothetical protein [Rathayibacter sp. VKM Ac-2630]
MLSTTAAIRPDSTSGLLGVAPAPLTVIDLGDSVDFYLATVTTRS